MNDYQIREIDCDIFFQEISAHSDAIDEVFWCIKEAILIQAYKSFKANREKVLRRYDKLLSSKKTHRLLKSLHWAKNELKSAKIILEVLWLFSWLLEWFCEDPSYQNFQELLNFLIYESEVMIHISEKLGLDFIGLVDFYINIDLPDQIRKLVLWCLDARINLLSFFQNSTQILASKQFMNPEYTGSLVLFQNEVQAIKKSNSKWFKDFKELQETHNESSDIYSIDREIGMYMDVLLWDSNIWLINAMSTWSTEMGTFEKEKELLQTFLILLQDYTTHMWEIYEKRRKKHLDKKWIDVWTWKQEELFRMKQRGINRLIRLYREEDNPLNMIKTWQNIFASMLADWYNVWKHSVTTVSVNYGWWIVWWFVRHTFRKIIGRWERMPPIEHGQVSYSLYDLKNAKWDVSIFELPTAASYQKWRNLMLERRDWTIILDDNTNSGETLHRLWELSENFMNSWKVLLVPCSIWTDMSKYSQILELKQIEWFAINAATQLKKTKINSEWRRYKERVWTIVGRRIYKELRRRWKF